MWQGSYDDLGLNLEAKIRVKYSVFLNVLRGFHIMNFDAPSIKVSLNTRWYVKSKFSGQFFAMTTWMNALDRIWASQQQVIDW
jgi:hypothetical protein